MIEIKDKPASGPTIRLHDNDNVLIARTEIGIGAKLDGGLTSRSQIPAGHKIAARAIKQGEPILKYAVTIGFASADIPAGTYVHSHNMEFREFDRDYAHARDYKPIVMAPEANRVTRTRVPASHLMIGLQCGGSDGFSSITANPALGSSMKGGTGPLMEVYRYAEPVKQKGFVFMDTPGFDPCSATGQIAGGANMIMFTTGRGSMFGAKPVPSIKLATNTPMYTRLTEDMDINCGEILDGTATLSEMGRKIFDLMLRTASGERSKSELLGLGDHEFVPWNIGVTG